MINSGSNTSSESSSSKDSVQQRYYNGMKSSKGPSTALLQWYEDVSCVLGLANVETWDSIVKKFGVKKPKSCAKAKGKRKLSGGADNHFVVVKSCFCICMGQFWTIDLWNHAPVPLVGRSMVPGRQGDE
ncbi:hypothetical protein Tco_0978546 [Tanacetum coccineum]|uniref:Uncharacterized protein n=1 Tax=Tanacetum coccineum TaxID=301880 RepID=A0ABQ5ENF7_9ASTR